MKKLFKTTIKVEVLSDTPVEFDSLGELEKLDVSLIYEVSSIEQLKKADFIKDCEKHGTDPEFFGI